MRSHERALVLGTPGVVNLVGTGCQSTPIPDHEIQALRLGAAQLSAEPHPFLKIGQRVRVRKGSLAGLEGVLVQKKQGFRFVLSADLIMQAMSVEIDAADIEPAGIEAHC
jgi:transcription antitermination factor NusG